MSILSALCSHILNTDSYKASHYLQYPEGTEYVVSYIEARGSKFAQQLGKDYDYAEFFGLQAFLKDYLSKPIDQDDIDLAEVLYRMHGVPYNKEGWQYILDHHGGKLPIEVRAIPEGTVLPNSNAMVEIVNTDPKAYWLTSYVETELLRAVWYPTTVATKSRMIKEVMRGFMDRTSDNSAGLDFMLHDFGARGNSSMESSGIGGMAHIVNFKGTDTVMGIVGSLGYYSHDFEKFHEQMPDRPKRAMINTLLKMEREKVPLPAFSVIASEHSTMTIKGEAGEIEQIKLLIDTAKTGRIVSIVSDSYDYFRNIEKVYGEQFKQDILDAGKAGGRIVIRPDSGDPVEVITKTLEVLCEKFKDECTTVKKGDKEFKLLPPCLRVLQGDGIDLDSLHKILTAMEQKGFSAENLVFGMGGGLEQKVDRDGLYFAQKACAARINGKWVDIQKNPKTASSKKSKAGVLSTIWNGVAFATKRTKEILAGELDVLKPVFRDGEILGTEGWNDVCDRAEYFTKRLREKATDFVANPWDAVSKKSQPAPGM